MKNKLIFLACIIFIAIILRLSALSKSLIENVYSRFFYKGLAGNLNKFFGKFSFSLGEILLIIFIILLILFIIFTVKNLITEKDKIGRASCRERV